MLVLLGKLCLIHFAIQQALEPTLLEKRRHLLMDLIMFIQRLVGVLKSLFKAVF